MIKQLFYHAGMKENLEKAVKLCGGQTALAKTIGVNQPNIWNWLNRANGVTPAEYCLKIEQATNGQVTRYDLRPDVFGSKADCDRTPAKEAA